MLGLGLSAWVPSLLLHQPLLLLGSELFVYLSLLVISGEGVHLFVVLVCHGAEEDAEKL